MRAVLVPNVMSKTSSTLFQRLTAWVTLLAFIFISLPTHATLSQARGRIIFSEQSDAAGNVTSIASRN